MKYQVLTVMCFLLICMELSQAVVPWFPPNIKRCFKPPVSGPCLAYIRSWYYNSLTRRCEQFVYGGCGGNDNNFQSRWQCYNACGFLGFLG
ncbi:hypothetical protein CHS0354_037680 [Potamilus streckersoni]|uniref:BPTI/Kunitz inhibitor domain-containing protein n=1 Tax=Potamilus streckersoni TaxID=2493646 RepID=A0AAE0W5U7_9BIVA|nr:hypothetical protein CHS0354_037680 [Potamilus streckersoni]